MKDRVIFSIFIGFETLAIVNLFISINHMNVIMTAVAIYALIMSVGQFLYKLKHIINDKALDKKDQKLYLRLVKIGEALLIYSLMITILLTLFLSVLGANYMEKIANSSSLLALGMIFYFISTHEKNY